MTAFMREFTKAARGAPRLFFAPITGAVEAVRSEMDRLTVATDRRRSDSAGLRGLSRRAKRD